MHTIWRFWFLARRLAPFSLIESVGRRFLIYRFVYVSMHSFTATRARFCYRAYFSALFTASLGVRAGICYICMIMILWSMYGDGGQDGIWSDFDSVCPPRPVLRGPGSVTASLMRGSGSDICMYVYAICICISIWLCMTLHAWFCLSDCIMILSVTLLVIWSGPWFSLLHFCTSGSDYD